MGRFQVLLHVIPGGRGRTFQSLFAQFSSDSQDLQLYDVLRAQAMSAEVSTYVYTQICREKSKNRFINKNQLVISSIAEHRKI